MIDFRTIICNQEKMFDTPTKVGPVEFAPLNVPLERRLQTLGAIYYSFVTFFFAWINLFLPFYVAYTVLTSFTHYWWLLVVYAIFYIFDYKTPRRGGRPCRFIQDLTLNKW
jgi:2-acylglycerol O-acyltransferase 1